ncbi:MAG: hypothetical protein HYZ92_01475 [Candidatus Omnitrophica bacterium]|nr:hypothetical protein [Candidatus Omnitrophota bacterium]
MPQRRVKINFAGQPADAASVETTQSTERWNEYLLDDGTVLKAKLVVTNIYRVDAQHDPEGNPIYVIQSTNVLSVNAPEELRRKP